MPHSRQTALTVAGGLVLIACACVVGTVVVACSGGTMPHELYLIASAAVGALAGHMGAMGYRGHNGDFGSQKGPHDS